MTELYIPQPPDRRPPVQSGNTSCLHAAQLACPRRPRRQVQRPHHRPTDTKLHRHTNVQGESEKNLPWTGTKKLPA